MPKYIFKITYNGTHYCGWQIQKNAPSVQQTFNETVQFILKDAPVSSQGCGRTDTGVHANEYFVHVVTQKYIEDKKQFLFKLNFALPKDITVHDVTEVSPKFNARFDAVKREYKYFISRRKQAFLHPYSWFIYGEMDVEKMKLAGQMIAQLNDFRLFCKNNPDEESTLCKIFNLQWEESAEYLVFTIEANRFLHNMVRCIVGTSVKLGQNKLDFDEFKRKINSNEKEMRFIYLAPANGLFLNKITYPENLFHFE
jgi:tRNA pseudouridine38-40 synthase